MAGPRAHLAAPEVAHEVAGPAAVERLADITGSTAKIRATLVERAANARRVLRASAGGPRAGRRLRDTVTIVADADAGFTAYQTTCQTTKHRNRYVTIKR